MVFKRVVQFFIVFLVITSVALGAGFWYAQQRLQQSLQLAQPLLFEVKRGMHARTVLQQLQQQGADIHVSEAYIVSRLLDDPSRLQAGVYQLSTTDSLQSLWRKLRLGEQHLFQVALIEGRTLHEWLQVLSKAEHIEEPLQFTHKHEAAERVAELLGMDSTSAEGWLFPDTYSYRAGTSVLDILREAHLRMQAELSETWQTRANDLPYENAYELLIMASIIEKETGLKGERKRVSSVFINRINKGMRLQSDPTTIYGIEPFDGNITRAHLREETAYNTYRISGLPPSPIAMPSKASLEAAANPEHSDYFYFVADGSGGHVFSKTLAEHNKAVNRYQRNQR